MLNASALFMADKLPQLPLKFSWWLWVYLVTIELSPSSPGWCSLNVSSLSTTDKLQQLTLWALSCHKLNFLLVQVDAQHVTSPYRVDAQCISSFSLSDRLNSLLTLEYILDEYGLICQNWTFPVHLFDAQCVISLSCLLLWVLTRSRVLCFTQYWIFFFVDKTIS